MSYSDKLNSIKNEIISKYNLIIIADAYKTSHNSTSSTIEDMAIIVDRFESKQREDRKKFYHDISEYLGESIMLGIDYGDKRASELTSSMLIRQVRRLSPDKLIGLSDKLNMEFINETEFLILFNKREFELNL
jgi:hypothetical protein